LARTIPPNELVRTGAPSHPEVVHRLIGRACLVRRPKDAVPRGGAPGPTILGQSLLDCVEGLIAEHQAIVATAKGSNQGYARSGPTWRCWGSYPASCPLQTSTFSPMWGLRPTTWLVLSSVADVLIITVRASRGIAMAPLSLSTLACEFAAAVVFGVILDGIKIPVFARLGIA
jgi:hypothetical protein